MLKSGFAVAKQLQKKKDWLEVASRRIISLCESYVAQAESFDVLPTDIQKQQALLIMKELQQASAPIVSLSVNAEIVLRWQSAGEQFQALVQPDGSIICYQNKTVMPHSAFVAHIARTTA